MLEEFIQHLKINLLYEQMDYQSAYKENYSCETSVLKIVNDILWAMEDRSLMALVAIDHSAAFDTIQHSVMLNTLENMYRSKGCSTKLVPVIPAG